VKHNSTPMNTAITIFSFDFFREIPSISLLMEAPVATISHINRHNNRHNTYNDGMISANTVHTRHATRSRVGPGQSAPLAAQNVACIECLSEDVIDSSHRLRNNASLFQQFLKAAVTCQRGDVVRPAASPVGVALLGAVEELNRVLLPTDCQLQSTTQGKARQRVRTLRSLFERKLDTAAQCDVSTRHQTHPSRRQHNYTL
jgi:hypothetical protein